MTHRRLQVQLLAVPGSGRVVRLHRQATPLDHSGLARSHRAARLAFARAPESKQFEVLVDRKAWELLGLTGAEFSQKWLRGDYCGSTDPHVRALETLVLSHRWLPSDPT